jgi:hypothetical protein
MVGYIIVFDSEITSCSKSLTFLKDANETTMPIFYENYLKNYTVVPKNE